MYFSSFAYNPTKEKKTHKPRAPFSQPCHSTSFGLLTSVQNKKILLGSSEACRKKTQTFLLRQPPERSHSGSCNAVWGDRPAFLTTGNENVCLSGNHSSCAGLEHPSPAWCFPLSRGQQFPAAICAQGSWGELGFWMRGLGAASGLCCFITGWA